MAGAGRLQSLGRMQLEHVLGMTREHGSEKRAGHERQDQQEADEGGPIARDARQHEDNRLHWSTSLIRRSPVPSEDDEPHLTNSFFERRLRRRHPPGGGSEEGRRPAPSV